MGEHRHTRPIGQHDPRLTGAVRQAARLAMKRAMLDQKPLPPPTSVSRQVARSVARAVAKRRKRA